MDPSRWLVTALPYGLLALLAVYSVAEGQSSLLPLCAVTAVWMIPMFTPFRHRRSLVLFAGLVVLTLILVLRSPAFGFFTTAAYIYAFTYLPWPRRIPAIASVAVVAGIAQSSSFDKDDVSGYVVTAIIIVLNILIMALMAWVLRREEVIQDELARLQAQLVAQAREAGILEERQRMAREIHDTVAQGLTGIIAQMQAAEQRLEVPPPWERPFAAVKQLARDSLTEARRSVDALRPAHLDSAHLAGAVREVAEHWSSVHGLPVRVETTGTSRPLDPDAESALLRTAQEALANVAKHANATRVGVTLSYLDDEVALDVIDDGAGFDPGTGREGGYGLTIMRQRVEAFHGTLQIETEPGAGTGISARIPLPAGGTP
ncbi:sensor histidine kinase [Actinoplanes sp. NPDC023714]|uniref:sensor histidine kinase n=1 Tax=Actinoplanes sp. NPDC023714 TaxID=3154322 RepID=UPI0033F89215